MIREYEALKFYDVSECGKMVVRVSDNRVMSVSKCRAGYSRVYFTVNGKRGNYGVSRLVATKYVENPNPKIYTDVNHINGNKSDDSYTNVEWCTKSQNQIHAYANGLNRTPSKKLRNKAIKDLRKIGYTTHEVADIFGISQPRIMEISRQ